MATLSVQPGPEDLDLGPCAPGDEAALFRLYRENFRWGERVVELQHWRRSLGGGPGSATTTVARLRGAVVGAVTAVPVTVSCRGRELRAAWQQESVVDASVRRQQLASRLVEAAASGFDLVLAKGISPAMHAVRRSVGFRDVPGARFRVRVLRPFGRVHPVLHPLGYLASRVTCRKSPPPELAVRRLEDFDDRFDALARERADDGSLHVSKTSLALRRRYCELPGRTYRILALEGADGDRGAAVLRPNVVPGGEAWLVDLIRGARDESVAHALIGAAVREAEGLGAGLLAAFATDSDMRRWLGDWGFFDSRRSPRFAARAQSEQARRLVDGSDWDFWHGDGDLETVS